MTRPGSTVLESQPLFAASAPAVAARMVHLDLKGLAPTFERMLQLIDLFAQLRYTHVIFEWEDMFPWRCEPAMVNAEAYTAAQVQAMCQRVRQHGMQVVPLVQCLGHLEYMLTVPRFADLREVPTQTRCLNPLAPGALQAVAAMQDDAIDLMGVPALMIIGGDEAWALGEHPDCAAFVQEHGRIELYLRHIEAAAAPLRARGIRPIVTHDMLAEATVEQIARLRDVADLLVWGYKEHPYRTKLHFRREAIDRFAAAGMTMWACTTYKAARGVDSDTPEYDKRQDNALAWLEVGRDYRMAGAIVTGWSRYDNGQVQTDPIDASLDTLVNAAFIYHDGKPVDDVLAVLETLGEADRFQRCREVMQQIGEVREYLWRYIRWLNHMVGTVRLEPHRGGSGNDEQEFRRAFEAMQRGLGLAEQARTIFAGLVMPRMFDFYLRERFEPLAEQLAFVYRRYAAAHHGARQWSFGSQMEQLDAQLRQA